MEKEVPNVGEEGYDSHRIYHRMVSGNARTKEQIVARQEMIELQNKLSLCYLTNGVNHIEVCKPLAEEYIHRLNHYKGYIPVEGDDTYATAIKMRVVDPSE